MYVLHSAPSTAGLAVHWMLIELGVPFELRMLDILKGDQRAPEYLALNPAGHVPTLQIEDCAYGEVAALLMMLAERHPERSFAPPLGELTRNDYLWWMVYLANTLQPAFRAWFYPHEPAGPAHAGAVQAGARPRIEAAWNRVDSRLADGRAHILGESLSAADFLLTMLTRWSRAMPKPASDWPHLRRYMQRMRVMPSLREVHAREGLTDWIDG